MSPTSCARTITSFCIPYYEAMFTKDVKYDVEKTGLGWKTEFKTTVADETLPTTCKMKRPSS